MTINQSLYVCYTTKILLVVVRTQYTHTTSLDAILLVHKLSKESMSALDNNDVTAHNKRVTLGFMDSIKSTTSKDCVAAD